jgi:hypothetical protein
MSQENHGRLAIINFKGGCDFGQLSLSVSGWLPSVVCLSGVNAATNWRRQHLITFLNCATQLLLPLLLALNNCDLQPVDGDTKKERYK